MKPITVWLAISIILLLSCGTSSSDIDTGMSNSNNPLPPCPDSPNCIRISTVFETSVDTLLVVTKEALTKMNAFSIEKNDDNFEFHAIFKIAVFGWKDDVNIVLKPSEQNAIMHIRSASRVGYSDLGVNKRRVKQLLKIINNTLKDN